MENSIYQDSRIFEIRKPVFLIFFYCAAVLITLAVLVQKINRKYSENSREFKTKQAVLSMVHAASPALITEGRNIAFEADRISPNVPASYFIKPVFHESYSAVSKSKETGRIRCEIIKSKKNE